MENQFFSIEMSSGLQIYALKNKVPDGYMKGQVIPVFPFMYHAMVCESCIVNVPSYMLYSFITCARSFMTIS